MTAVSSMRDERELCLAVIGIEPALARQVSAIAHRAQWRVALWDELKQLARCSGPEPEVSIAAALVDGRCLLGVAPAQGLKAGLAGVPILVLTEATSTLSLVRLLRLGASATLETPLIPEQLLKVLKAIAAKRFEGYVEFPGPPNGKRGDLTFERIVGNDSSLRTALAKAALAARGRGHVLIEGERGTGKKLLAQVMHSASLRASMPLETLDLRELTPNDLESALYGHEKCAFLGAFEKKIGALQRCDGGTVVLDGIDRLAAQQQNSLMRTILEDRVRPLGANHAFRTNVRIFSLSERPLTELVQRGKFLPDLHRELSQTWIEIPPLRNRSNDVVILARHFLTRLHEETGLGERALSPDVVDRFREFNWPGNITQLQSEVIRAASLSSGSLLAVHDFPCLLRRTARPTGAVGLAIKNCRAFEEVKVFEADGNIRPLAEIEADVIQVAIKLYNGRLSEVARRLKIGRSTLYRKVSEFVLP